MLVWGRSISVNAPQLLVVSSLVGEIIIFNMAKKIFFILAALIMFGGFFNISPAVAQLGAAQGNLSKALNGTGLSSGLDVTIGIIIKTLLSLVGTIFLLLTIYAGILWMTARGNEESVTKAKEIIQAAVIGLVITMAAYAITAFITGKLSGAGSSSGTTSGGGITPPPVTSCTTRGGTCYNSDQCATGSEITGTDCADGWVCCDASAGL